MKIYTINVVNHLQAYTASQPRTLLSKNESIPPTVRTCSVKDNVVFKYLGICKIPCRCETVYIVETGLATEDGN
jgi:hypothetical protein